MIGLCLLQSITSVILSEAKLQRSPERFRGEARLSISVQFCPIRPKETDETCLKDSPRSSHFVAALRSAWQRHCEWAFV